MCALQSSSRRGFVLVNPGGPRGGDLFLEIRPEPVAVNCRTAVLLFAALVQHARWYGRARREQS